MYLCSRGGHLPRLCTDIWLPKNLLPGTEPIPDADKKGFYEYVSDAVDDKGNSKELIDRQNETLEQRLMLSYLRYKGFNLDKLVALKARETKVKGLKEMIKKSAKIESTPVNDNQRVTSGESDITIGSLLGN